MKVGHKHFGIYRGLVVNNKDPEKKGRCAIWIPTIMVNIDPSKGLWANPANNPIGGRNSEYDSSNNYAGTCYIPRKGSYVFIFFEDGNINNPCYLSACDLENTPVLPENQSGSNYQDKWTIFKSTKGRCIVISDDPDDERVEITGKKRNLSNPPTGDISSVFTIDGNQTTILLDETSGKEKILIRTYKGDFINIDVTNQKLQIKFKSDINIETDGNLNLKVTGNFNIEVDGKMSTLIVGTDNKMVGGQICTTSSQNHSIQGSDVAIDGRPQVSINSGSSTSATTSSVTLPIGDR